MAHFAKINKNNIVEQVIVVGDKDINYLDYPESESVGQEYLKQCGFEGTWLQTSYNKRFRGNYAGIGSIYDPDLDAFISKKPFESWIFDEKTFSYKPPFLPPKSETIQYEWDEDSTSWKKLSKGKT